MVDIRIANKNISVEIDTGASLTVIGKHSYDKLFANKGIKLTPFKGTIKTYTGEVIKPTGGGGGGGGGGGVSQSKGKNFH